MTSFSIICQHPLKNKKKIVIPEMLKSHLMIE